MKSSLDQRPAASECATQQLSFCDPLTIKAHRGCRISQQSLLIDAIATCDTVAVAAVDQAILRIVNVAQPLFEFSPMEPFNLLCRVFCWFDLVDIDEIMMQWALGQDFSR